MKNLIMFIGIVLVVLSFIRIIGLAGMGYTENRDDIGLYVLISVIGYVVFLFGNSIGSKAIKDQELKDSIRDAARKDIVDRMKRWDKELSTKEGHTSSLT